VFAAAFAQLAVACASTARQPSGQEAAPLAAAPQASAPAGAAPVETGAVPPGPDGSGAQAGNPTTEVPSSPGSPPAPKTGSTDPPVGVAPSPVAVPVSGPGVTPDTITVGFPFPRDPVAAQEEWDEVTGDVSPPPMNWIPVLQSIVEDINARGGVLGRKLQLHVWLYDTTDYPTLADYIEAECAYFTQDVEVFTVYMTGGDSETLECYRQHEMPVIVNWTNLTDDVVYAENPNVFTISYPGISRISRLMADGLADAGFLTRGSKIGLVSFDHPVFRRAVDQALKPALAARGLSLSAEVHVTPPRTPEALGVMMTEINAAVVRFRAEGIEKVLFLDVNALLGYYFINAAEDQQYRGFRYGLTSGTGGDTRDSSGERFLPAEQMDGAVLLGWAPLGDIAQAEGFKLLPPTASRCRALLERNGFRFDPDNCCRLWFGLEWCNRLWFLDAALEAQKGDAINIASFIRGAESLGSSFEPTDSLGARFAKGRHDGPSVYRVLRWSPPCQCFRYTTGLQPMP
jgi:hypothetical protein